MLYIGKFLSLVDLIHAHTVWRGLRRHNRIYLVNDVSQQGREE
jgi:hypothetical protein